MIITFCGHARFCETEKYREKMLAFLEEKVGDAHAELYLGNYGAFDAFSYQCCKIYQKTHPNAKLVFVTPYLRLEKEKAEQYDEVLYPPIEDKPFRFAILYRNRYTVEKADCVIAYIDHTWGGAYKTYQYAKKKEKEIFNLAESF